MWLFDKLREIGKNIDEEATSKGGYFRAAGMGILGIPRFMLKVAYQVVKHTAGFAGAVIGRGIEAGIEFVVIPAAVIVSLYAAWKTGDRITLDTFLEDVEHLKDKIIEFAEKFDPKLGVVAAFVIGAWAKVASEQAWKKYTVWMDDFVKHWLGYENTKGVKTASDAAGWAGEAAAHYVVDTVISPFVWAAETAYSYLPSFGLFSSENKNEPNDHVEADSANREQQRHRSSSTGGPIVHDAESQSSHGGRSTPSMNTQ